MVADIAGDCCAERGADAHCGADYSLRQIVMASAAHDIGENEGDDHAKYCGRYAIEQLDCDHESRLAACRKRSAAYSQCQEAQHKQRTPAPAFGSAANGGRDGDHHELRRENAYRKDERCGLGKPRGEETRHDRQRGGIAKLEQEHRAGENDERTVVSQRPKCIRSWMRLLWRPSAAREIRVNVGRSDESEREERWHAERGCEHKDRAVREIIADNSHNGSGNNIAERKETGIAPKPDTQQGIADETEADGGHRRSHKAACDSMQQLGDHHRAEARRLSVASVIGLNILHSALFWLVSRGGAAVKSGPASS